MELLMLLASFWVPLAIARGLGANWWVSIIAGSVACGSLFTYLVSKSIKEWIDQGNRGEREVRERAEMAM